ncbi:GNAT family N-acetyltransferase [Halobacteriaceae archaeon SHR40]|uniref:GNAT family N-acetyltransferase n=1 Tax=Halovenus amylolytica TaxID=2500550 RepID=UPI000FE2F70B
MSSVTVRRARPDDTDAVVALAGRSWRAAYGDILDEETIAAALGEWYSPEGTREAIQSERVGYFVATDREIVGYVSGHAGETTAQLGAIYVDPDRWGEGIGTQLLERFEQYSHDRGCERIELEVLADNDLGESFYRARGYTPVETQEVELFGETVRETLFQRSI